MQSVENSELHPETYEELRAHLEAKDKEGAIELYYRLLCSGRSVAEIISRPISSNNPDEAAAVPDELSPPILQTQSAPEPPGKDTARDEEAHPTYGQSFPTELFTLKSDPPETAKTSPLRSADPLASRLPRRLLGLLIGGVAGTVGILGVYITQHKSAPVLVPNTAESIRLAGGSPVTPDAQLGPAGSEGGGLKRPVGSNLSVAPPAASYDVKMPTGQQSNFQTDEAAPSQQPSATVSINPAAPSAKQTTAPNSEVTTAPVSHLSPISNSVPPDANLTDAQPRQISTAVSLTPVTSQPLSPTTTPTSLSSPNVALTIAAAPSVLPPAAASPSAQGESASTTTASSASWISPADIDALLLRGDAFLTSRDLTSARLFYQRAADAGNGRAALRMGQTFDPAILEQGHFSRGISDHEKAAFWYRRARDLGNEDAALLLQYVESVRQ